MAILSRCLVLLVGLLIIMALESLAEMAMLGHTLSAWETIPAFGAGFLWALLVARVGR